MRWLALGTLFALLASCAPQPAPAAVEEFSKPQITLVQETPAHAPEIRFALIGAPQDINVWQLWDGENVKYADFAVRADFWTRLYHLYPADLSLQPRAALLPPADIKQDGEFFTASIPIRPVLKWSDGAPLTAEDIAFTANTALTYELGFEWAARYPREYLLRAEAEDTHTVKFIFKQKPNVGAWQYGVLQGVIVQKKFWQPKVDSVLSLLPPDSLKAEIENAKIALATVEADIARLQKELYDLRSAGQGNRELTIQLTQRERQLGFAQNELNRLLNIYAIHIAEAHQALYSLDDENEPTLGAWTFGAYEGNFWVNTANPSFPFGQPNFDRAVYQIFENEEDAIQAYKSKKADFILSPGGLSQTVEGAKRYPTYSARFLHFNPSIPAFADSSLRRALSCIMDRTYLAEEILKHQAAPLSRFILSPQWSSPEIKPPCDEMSSQQRIETAVEILSAAGYTWRRKPNFNTPGRELFSPDGKEFPEVKLITPAEKFDPLRYAAAKYIQEQAAQLGIKISVQETRPEDVTYAVYSSQKYDAALVGWKLGEYPAYLCEWFDGGNAHLYRGIQFAADCESFQAETNLERAKEIARRIENALVSAPPLIPLFTVTQIEAYQHIAFPSKEVWNGWVNWHGAPFYAMPSP